MTSPSDSFAWLDKVIYDHKTRGQEYSNEKERMLQTLIEENEFLKCKLSQFENRIYDQDLRTRIAELEDEKKEMFIQFKEINLLKEKQIQLLNEKIESLKKIMNDDIEQLSMVVNEKDTLSQYLKVINNFFTRINHHLVNYNCISLDDKDKASDIAALEAKFKTIEYILQQNAVSNDKQNKDRSNLYTRNQSNQLNPINSFHSVESNKSKMSNQGLNRKLSKNK